MQVEVVVLHPDAAATFGAGYERDALSVRIAVPYRFGFGPHSQVRNREFRGASEAHGDRVFVAEMQREPADDVQTESLFRLFLKKNRIIVGTVCCR